MKVFVTGHRGYIGTHLVDVLQQAGHVVTGCDLGLFDGCEWEPPIRPDRELKLDIRALQDRHLRGHDCVMHLAAISNDPMGALNPELTYRVNRDASVHLAQLARQAGVGRFLFSGSCSVYGQGASLDLDETAPLNPLTAYARSKVETEAGVAALADESFTPVFLRNATAYGHSPMLRIDLVANNLLASAVAYNQIRIHSDGRSWRPLVHCRDIARAFLALAQAPADRVRGQAINIGANQENFQVKDVADRVQALLPKAQVFYTGEVGNDPRSYRVVFDRLYSILPDFKLEYTLAAGLAELHRQLHRRGFTAADFEGDRFVRLRTLKSRLDRLEPAAATA